MKDNLAMPPPTDSSLSAWAHYNRVRGELQGMQAIINKVKAMAARTTSAGHIRTQKAAPVSQKCTPRVAASRGAEVQVHGVRYSVAQVVRTACNRLLRGQDRNLLGRFRGMGNLRATLVKDSAAREAGEDIEVGSNVLTVFQGDPVATGVEYIFQVGQVRQISAAKHQGRKEKQCWLSVSNADSTALFFCSPWAVVDAVSGKLLFCDEPKEYYGLQVGEHDSTECMDDNADMEEEVERTKHVVAPLLMKGVGIDWDNRVLTNVDDVLGCIKELM